MPPLRTFASSKPMKTERTHEENQERAYIAASRRSDRSLEARVESARRASEIHKRRTGRSLRVTEQDVINEEMYEEEDDDLPMGYRRLTAHLQTGSADFNRRLAAYLTNHVAMRSALDQAIHPYAYPNALPMGQGQSNMFPSPLMTQGISTAPQQHTPTSPRSAQSAHPYRQSPYPMPGTPGYRPQQKLHNRSVSMSIPRGASTGSQSFAVSPVEAPNPDNPRRMSMPTATVPENQTSLHVPSRLSRPSLSRQGSATSHHEHSAISEEREVSSATSMAPPPQPYFDPNLQYGISPLTMNLPQDSQQLLGPALNTNDPFSSMLMASNQIQAPSYYQYGSSGGNIKQQSNNAPFPGMESTLAPSALSVKQDGEGALGAFNEAPTSNFSDIKGFEFPGSQNSSNGENSTNGQDAPWDAFIDDKSWNENAT